MYGKLELFVREAESELCSPDNEYNGEHFKARLSAIFVVLIASAFGSFFPILSSKYSFIKMPTVVFFFAKFFGSGVIIATAFIHLLQPGNESLSNACLGYPFDVYPFAFGICLIVLMLMFFLELIFYRWLETSIGNKDADFNENHTHSHFGETSMYVNTGNVASNVANGNVPLFPLNEISNSARASDDTFHRHSGDVCDHPIPQSQELESFSSNLEKCDGLEHTDSKMDNAVYSAQVLNVFILEFGIIFHSIFVGLTLACSGDEFISLYIVIVFHQMFEGLGLGTRVACVEWPQSKRYTPWVLCLAYTFCTPIAIAIGLGVRNSYPPGSRHALITNGVFDSISAGILIYTGCIELMAHEFLFSDEFKGEGGFKKMIYAYLIMCLGAGIMALLGRWA